MGTGEEHWDRGMERKARRTETETGIREKAAGVPYDTLTCACVRDGQMCVRVWVCGGAVRAGRAKPHPGFESFLCFYSALPHIYP